MHPMKPRHFLTLQDISSDEFRSLINRGIELKAQQKRRELYQPFLGYVMGMIFEKSSTRTRVSFETGMAQMGGHALFLSPRDTQLGRGEPIEDSARVLSSMVDILILRTFGHDVIERFSEYSSVPVINALTDDYHPCQLLADMQTFFENRGDIQGKTVCWIGDGNNMCHSYINAAHQLDFELRVACPEGYEPNAALMEKHGDRVSIVRKPEEAARDAHLLATDVWASMGQEEESGHRMERFSGYQLNQHLLDQASSDALYMHCLPAHRGEEISAELMERSDSVVWSEAENRLHAQKALVEFLLLQSR